MKKHALIFALAIALAGCASTGVNVSDAQVSKFKQGETSKTEVLAALGRPTGQSKQSDGTSSLIYSYGEYKTRAASFIPVVGIFAGGADMQSNVVTFQFDANEKLIGSSSSASEISSNMFGSTVKPTTSVEAK